LIDSEMIERAETFLQIIYGGTPDSLPRQMQNLQVSLESYQNFHQHRIETLRGRYRRSWHAMDPRLEPAINTLLTHFFMVGLVSGRLEEKGAI